MKSNRLALLCIVLLAIALRLSAFNGFGAVDDAEYARFAHAISKGQFSVAEYQGPAVFPLRLGIILPTALLFKLFGVHEWTMVGFPFAISILGVLAAYWGAKLFFSVSAGLIGALLWAVLPIDSFHASLLIPDPAGALISGAAVLLLVHSFRNRSRTVRHSWLSGYVAGLMFGYSWLCKTSLVYLSPFVLILCVTTLKNDSKHNLPVWIAATAGLFSIIAAEAAFYYFNVGDGLFRIHAVQRNVAENPAAFDTTSVGHLKSIVKRVVLTGPLTILIGSQFLFLPFLAFLSGIHALYWKDNAFRLPLVWLLTLVIIFNFGSISLNQYQPLLLFERYLFPLFLPATIIVSGLFDKLLAGPSNAGSHEDKLLVKERRFWAVLLIALVFIVAIHRNYRNTTWNPNWTTAVKSVSQIVTPEDRIYADILSINGLDFFWGYPEKSNSHELKYLKHPSEMPEDSYLLINASYLDWLKRKQGWWPNLDRSAHKIEFDSSELDRLETVFRSSDTVLYRAVDKGYDGENQEPSI